MSQSQPKFAVLIDGDNVGADLVQPILAEVARYGLATVRRVYGDWSSRRMKGWKTAVREYGLLPVQQFAYVRGKNATDFALVIEAMDILHGGDVDGFAIVSGDSDYTRLVGRVRESGRQVIGFGGRAAAKSLVQACNVFVYLDNIAGTESTDAGVSSVPAESPDTEDSPQPDREALQALAGKAYDMVADEDGWANLAALGSTIRKLDPGFDPRTYGQRNLSGILETFLGGYEFQRREDGARTSVRRAATGNA